jgi:quercetin dioxygenase-like cupin family protein
VRGTGEDRDHRRRTIWTVEAEAEPALDIATQMITFEPGGHSGWHTHPGPVFISVIEGTMTFYEGDDPDCEPLVLHAGQGFVDGRTDRHAHIARNETAHRPKPGHVLCRRALLCATTPGPGSCPFQAGGPTLARGIDQRHQVLRAIELRSRDRRERSQSRTTNPTQVGQPAPAGLGIDSQSHCARSPRNTTAEPAGHEGEASGPQGPLGSGWGGRRRSPP